MKNKSKEKKINDPKYKCKLLSKAISHKINGTSSNKKVMQATVNLKISDHFKTMLDKEFDLLNCGIESPILKLPDKP